MQAQSAFPGIVDARIKLMLAILSLAGIAFGAGLWVMVREIGRAPLGYQDETGFHHLPAPQVQTSKQIPARVERARAA